MWSLSITVMLATRGRLAQFNVHHIVLRPLYEMSCMQSITNHKSIHFEL